MTFSPARTAIIAITQANPCVVTTATNHNLSTGNVVRLHVPKAYGMLPLNNNTYQVTVLSPTTFSLQFSQITPPYNVDSTYYPAFSVPSNPQFTAEVLCIGSGPTPLTNTPVQVLNNVAISDVKDQVINISTTPIPF